MKKPQRRLTSSDTQISSFDVKNLKPHLIEQEIDETVVAKADQALMLIARQYSLHPDQIFILLMQLLQMNIIQFYPVEHISPRSFICGLTMLKSSVEYARQISNLNTMLATTNTLNILESKITTLLEDLPVKYNEIPKLSENVKNLASMNS